MANELDVIGEVLDRLERSEAGIGALPGELPVLPIPFRALASGLYEYREPIRPPIPRPFPFPEPIPSFPPRPGPLPGDGFPFAHGSAEAGLLPFPPIPPLFLREELRLDVDGRYPQMVASGIASGSLISRVQWIANLTSTGPDQWGGAIWFKEGSTSSFPYTAVAIQVTRSWYANQRVARVTFTGAGPVRVRTYAYKSASFHPVEIEFDCAEGEAATTSLATCAHPNHPATLACEQLSIQTVYQRAGFAVATSPGGGVVPIAGAGPNAKWSDQEMHDAMQIYWSRFASRAQWALWAFFASLHESGTSLGGIMFDDIGANHRQGTAIFNDSFISQPPATEPQQDRAAWVRRMIFWTACHEIGHCFNLAHSWDKQHPASWGTPWIPMVDEPEARSFMNYPYNVSGGERSFFSDFEFRFSDGELLFMRHAPERYVQMGNAEWFDHHGFREANVLPEPTYRFDLRVNRDRPIFEFMEPVVVELKLTNTSRHAQLVDERILSSWESMIVIVKPNGRPARSFTPYHRHCWEPKPKPLAHAEASYESLFLSAGIGGWYLAEPGRYTVQIALHIGGEDIVSNPLELCVRPPRGHEEDVLAQDYFSDDVGRILSLDGSRYLSDGNDVLREVSEKLADRPVALHAGIALGEVLRKNFKELVVDPSPEERKLSVEIRPSSSDEAEKLLQKALLDESERAVESLGHVDYKWYMDRFSEWLADRGEPGRAGEIQSKLHRSLEMRRVNGRPVLDRVLDEIESRKESYSAQKGKGPTRSSTRHSS